MDLPDDRANAELLARLIHARVPDPRRDMRKLWRWAEEKYGVDPTSGEPTQAAQKAYHDAVLKRSNGMPVSKIIGMRDFWKRSFIVTADVLDPRPDTETLVEAALGVEFASVLDLGTGSGCVLVSLLDERPEAQGLGVDISEGALEVARRNAKASPNARFACSDWFEAVTGRFDLIVSNPPYVTLAEWHDLDREVRDHDPRNALTDEGDGLAAYRLIASRAKQYLTAKGHVMVEIGHEQGAAVLSLFSQAGFSDVKVLQDMAGRDRVVTGRGQ